MILSHARLPVPTRPRVDGDQQITLDERRNYTLIFDASTSFVERYIEAGPMKNGEIEAVWLYEWNKKGSAFRSAFFPTAWMLRRFTERNH
jgi:hypothetical protein